MTHYETLGVDPGADDAEIKRAYRKRVKTAHADVGGTDEEMRKVTGAWLVLRDPARRAHYDRTGDDRASTVDTVREEALAIIAQAVSEALVSKDAASVNFPKVMRSNLQAMNAQSQAQLNHTRRECEKQLKQVERNAKRWSRKADAAGPDVIEGITANAVTSIRRALAQAEATVAHDLAVRAAVIEILDGYEYEHDPASATPPGVRQWQSIMSTSGNNW